MSYQAEFRFAHQRPVASKLNCNPCGDFRCSSPPLTGWDRETRRLDEFY